MSVVINGSAGVTTNSGAVYDGIQRGTAVTASGTSVNFTGIPSWVKRITVMFNVVSTNGTSIVQIQLGDSGGIETTSYAGSAVNIDGAIGGVANSTGFQLSDSNSAASTMMGIATITLLGSNLWVFNFTGALGSGAGNNTVGAGVKTLSDTLTQVRITTVNGTDTFDAGTINILFE
jgi:hypothetical protein